MGYGVGGGERLYTYRYTVTTRMTPALRWAAMRAILVFHNCEGQSHKTVSEPTGLKVDLLKKHMTQPDIRGHEAPHLHRNT